MLRKNVFYKLVLEGGHVGAGKSHDMVRYFEGDSILSVIGRALRTPRTKRKEFGAGIKLIQEISWREYARGKKREGRDPYLTRR